MGGLHALIRCMHVSHCYSQPPAAVAESMEDAAAWSKSRSGKTADADDDSPTRRRCLQAHSILLRYAFPWPSQCGLQSTSTHPKTPNSKSPHHRLCQQTLGMHCSPRSCRSVASIASAIPRAPRKPGQTANQLAGRRPGFGGRRLGGMRTTEQLQRQLVRRRCDGGTVGGDVRDVSGRIRTSAQRREGGSARRWAAGLLCRKRCVPSQSALRPPPLLSGRGERGVAAPGASQGLRLATAARLERGSRRAKVPLVSKW